MSYGLYRRTSKIGHSVQYERLDPMNDITPMQIQDKIQQDILKSKTVRQRKHSIYIPVKYWGSCVVEW